MYALNSLIEYYRGRSAATRDAVDLLPEDAKSLISALERGAEAAELMTDGLARIGRLVRRLARKINTDSLRRVHAEFYMRVIYAINQAPGSPREALNQFHLSWNPNRRIRLAMVGDNYTNDVKPVVALADMLGTKMMSVWIRGQSKHGRVEVEGAGGTEKRWLECHTIADATRYLLDEEMWNRFTRPIEKPAHVFGSAIAPAADSDESIEWNTIELLAGVTAVRNPIDKSHGSAPNREMMEVAERFVREVLEMVVKDIRVSPSERDEVINTLLMLCSDDPGSDKTALSKSAEFGRAVVELLLAVAMGDTGGDDGESRYQKCLAVLADLLHVEHADWAGAVVLVLKGSPEAKDDICKSTHLTQRYLERLKPLTRKDPRLPRGFPTRNSQRLYWEIAARAASSIAPEDHRGTRNDQSASAGTRNTGTQSTDGGRVVSLGLPCKNLLQQQSVYLGKNEQGDSVRCFLGGPKVRNIVCICGSPGSGKSSSLDALVLGALGGESAERASPLQSVVIVFHHELSGACPFAERAQQFGFPAKVFAFENELPSIRKEYPFLSKENVKPLRFRLDQLPDETLLRWIGLPEERALARRFLDAYGSAKDLRELRNGIENAPPLSRREKDQILRGLDKLEPIVARRDEPTLSEEVKPGHLAVIDCGRAGGLAGRLRAWDIVLSVLEKHWDSQRKDEHCLLVFDELHQVFRRNADPDVKQFANRLSVLVDRMGRHQQVSMVAASQKPKDFREAGDIWEGASVLLFHTLSVAVRDVPNGKLWEIAKNHHPDFSNLAVGKAWYCSKEQDEARDSARDKAITGYVRVQLRS
jgi:hypothetical protein